MAPRPLNEFHQRQYGDVLDACCTELDPFVTRIGNLAVRLKYLPASKELQRQPGIEIKGWRDNRVFASWDFIWDHVLSPSDGNGHGFDAWSGLLHTVTVPCLEVRSGRVTRLYRRFPPDDARDSDSTVFSFVPLKEVGTKRWLPASSYLRDGFDIRDQGRLAKRDPNGRPPALRSQCERYELRAADQHPHASRTLAAWSPVPSTDDARCCAVVDTCRIAKQ